MKRLVFAVLLLLPACEKSQPGSQPPTSEGGGAKPELTASACEARGGTVIGDIGDGAVHRPNYTCESNGQAPLGTIVPEDGGPVAVEGSVCCGT